MDADIEPRLTNELSGYYHERFSGDTHPGGCDAVRHFMVAGADSGAKGVSSTPSGCYHHRGRHQRLSSLADACDYGCRPWRRSE